KRKKQREKGRGFMENSTEFTTNPHHELQQKLLYFLQNTVQTAGGIIMVDVCKDCEFRYICQDCRAYLKNSDDLYSKPLKCTYNPYEGVWE
ncbi:MAG TPA: hypothetical protein VKZ95_09805, partial [Sphingobacteriaceae bacterium]|nr:hypothetical protein [Sphingobacteriaceae bacterium]